MLDFGSLSQNNETVERVTTAHMLTKARMYHKRVSFFEEEDEQCWIEENDGANAHDLMSVQKVRNSSGYCAYNM